MPVHVLTKSAQLLRFAKIVKDKNKTKKEQAHIVTSMSPSAVALCFSAPG
jgi:hypothetical protein